MFTLTLSNYFGSLGNPGENWFVVIDSCQNKVSADQYHLTVLWAQVSTHPGRVLFEVIRWQVTSIQMIAGSSFFLIHMKYVVLMSPWPRAISILISNWPQIENSTSYLKVKSGKTDAFHFPHHIHALVTLYVQFLCSDWSKFDRWAHAENLCSILNLVYFDSWSWQSFVSTCDVFNCLFPLDVQNEIQLLSRVFCYSWLVCLLNFWLRNAPLVKVGNPISDGIVFVHHAGCGLKKSQAILVLLDSFQELHLEWSSWVIIVFVFVCFLFLISWRRAQFMRLVHARLYKDLRQWSDLVWSLILTYRTLKSL